MLLLPRLASRHRPQSIQRTEGLEDLGAAVVRAADGSPYDGKSNADIAQDALAIWVETRLGLKEVNLKPLRASPRSLEDAAKMLSDDSAQSLDVCERALKNSLLAFSLAEKDRGCPDGDHTPLFAFKLHQFISGAGSFTLPLISPDPGR